MATAAVTMSDGSTFSGALAVSLDGNGTQTMQVSGLQLQVLQPGWGAQFGVASPVSVSATQNGFAVSTLFNATHP